MKTQEPLDHPIVMVDDETHALLGMKLTLRTNLGLKNIITFSDSSEALTYLQSHQPSLLLLDIGMPKISGDRLLQTIRQLYPQLPILMITAEAEMDKIDQCLKNGASNYILKPVRKDLFIPMVEYYLGLTNLSTPPSPTP